MAEYQLTPKGKVRTVDLIKRTSTSRKSLITRGCSAKETSHTYRNEVRVIKKRIRTSSWNQLLHDTTHPRAYGDNLFKELMQRMVQLQLQIERMTPSLYRWLLPRDNASATQLKIFDAMTRHAMTVTNAQLKQIMNMELSTTASPPTREGHHFYVRTWTFKIEELKSLLGHFRQDDTYFTELKEWAQEIHAGEACGIRTLTVRKWGTCKGPERPIDRHIEDLKQWSSGIFGEFLNITEAWAPEVAAGAEIFLLPDAFVPIDKVSQLFAEDTERLLIQFGHFPTTLNRQPGGFYSSFLPDAEDVRAFRQMDTNVLHRFSQLQNDFPRTSADELATHFEDVQFYANEFPDETGTSSRPFSDSLRKVMLRQGTPTQFHGHTLMLCIGKDITRTDYLAEASFMSGDSRAGVLTKEVLARVATCEAASNGRGAAPLPFKACEPLWLFNDLWPWLWHKNTDQAIVFLQAYMQIVRPVIAATFSRPVNDITCADFKHSNGISMSTFTPSVGNAAIHFYGDTTYDQESKEASAFINIPHIHPGRDKYGPQDVRLRRVLELTWYLTFLYISVTMDVITSHGPNVQKISRLQLCEEVLGEVHRLRHDPSRPEFRTFFARFEDAKQDLTRHFAEMFGSSKPRSSSSRSLALDHLRPVLGSSKSRSSSSTSMAIDDVRPMLDDAGILKLETFGRADGAAHSLEREVQLQDLWEKNMPDLHLAIPHVPENKERWIESLKGLHQRQYLYLAVIAQLPLDDYAKELLSHFAPPGSTNDQWLGNASARNAATIRAGLWIEKQPITGTSLRAHHPQSYVPATQQQGREIGVVRSNGLARIRWLREDKKRTFITISVKSAIPSDNLQTRFLDFCKEGVNIVDANGKACVSAVRGDEVRAATVPWPAFQSNEALRSLWLEVLELNGIEPPVAAFPKPATRDWGPAGVKALSNKANEEKPMQNHPPHPNDANYILVQFLDRTFPQGGTWESMSQDKLPTSKAHLDAFREFINREEFYGHPYLAFWNEKMQPDNLQGGVLSKNIAMFRSCIKRDMVNITQDGTRYTKGNNIGDKLIGQNTLYDIGPPGSRLPDPFVVVKGTKPQSCVYSRKGSKAYDIEHDTNFYKTKKPKQAKAGDDDDDELEEVVAEAPKEKRTSKIKSTSRASKKKEDQYDDGDDFIDDTKNLQDLEDDSFHEGISRSRHSVKVKKRKIAGTFDDGQDSEDSVSMPKRATKRRKRTSID